MRKQIELGGDDLVRIGIQLRWPREQEQTGVLYACQRD